MGNKNESKGFLWKVEGSKGIAYICGTVHVGFKGLYPINKKIKKAFNDSSNIYCEANLNKIGLFSIKQYKEVVSKYMLYPKGDNVYNHLSVEAKKKYRTLMDKLKIKEYQITRAKPIYLITLNEQQIYKKCKMSEQKGLDKYFLKLAKRKKKNIIELEGFEKQMSSLCSLTDKCYEELIDNAVSTTGSLKFVNSIESIKRSFKTGVLDNQLKEELSTNNSVNKVLLSERNDNMLKTISEKIDNSLDVNFVLVGLGHLVGLNNIINEFRKKGYKVSKI